MVSNGRGLGSGHLEVALSLSHYKLRLALESLPIPPGFDGTRQALGWAFGAESFEI